MEATNQESNNPLAALSAQIAAAVERAAPAIVSVDARPRVRTSGVIWRPGVVVSTNHTVRRDEEIAVALHDGREVQATLAGRDPGTDLAVLRIEGGDDAAGAANIPEKVADAAALKVGHLVLALGRAQRGQGVSASLGVVGVAGDRWRTWGGGEVDRLVRPDISIFIGFSGGALVDAEGRVLGVNTTGLARGGGVTVPVSTVDRVVDELLARGRVARPYLGVGMYHPTPLPERLRERFGLRQKAAPMILSVEPGGPADKAGVLIGDVLLALGGIPVEDPNGLRAALSGRGVGDSVAATLLRAGEVMELEITLTERPTRGR